MTIGIELFCHNCNFEKRVKDADSTEAHVFRCPECGEWLHRSRFLTCECGNIVYLNNSLTNECDGCGQLYNGFGQKLAPPDEWEENWDEDY